MRAAQSRWRLEQARESGDALDERVFPLAPTDASPAGNCITWALVFPRCPLPARLFAALDDLLHAFPILAGRPTPGKRYEVHVRTGLGVVAEYATDDAVSADDLLAGGLGFLSAPLQFPAAPREQLPYLALPDVAAMDKGDAPLLQCVARSPHAFCCPACSVACQRRRHVPSDSCC